MIIDAVIILISDYLTAKVLFIAAVSLLDFQLDILSTSKKKKNRIWLILNNDLFTLNKDPFQLNMDMI